ncbi:endonuclease domain-containing protein [Sphingobium sp. JS3065]|uniref:endonuclease domain-containing protein n=1 Tax=Sphingobium sp. JS3065 TaxID=2970925 RepID=UPI002263CE3B|nr:endonuclease domain-containing protein [Sphingobium sp. JS3065]UZW57274.1 endonuclease domain-containing protein [Sphingobium sp. JS3065]
MPPKRKTVAQARGLRRELSPPEVALWQWMRERPDGVKFRRQHPVGPFVLDFYCASARLGVEVDGSGHDSADRVVRDERRDAWLNAQNIHVLRIKAVDVLREFEAVTVHILHHCRAFPLHHSLRERRRESRASLRPSPSFDGEDF